MRIDELNDVDFELHASIEQSLGINSNGLSGASHLVSRGLPPWVN
jgi:hypothetical protein